MLLPKKFPTPAEDAADVEETETALVGVKPEKVAVPGKQGFPYPEAIKLKAMALVGAGYTKKSIAEFLGISTDAILAWQKDEEYNHVVTTVRQAMKKNTIERAEKLNPKLLDRLEKTIDKGDAKDVDALARAAVALEKVAASASGENKQTATGGKMELTIKFPEWVPKVDVIDSETP
jgi:hypothetical protein